MTYIEEFLERNKNKPFITNLQKYYKLNHYQKLKCITSFLTHVFIDAENGIQNEKVQIDLVSIINEMIFIKTDRFLDWLQDQIK